MPRCSLHLVLLVSVVLTAIVARVSFPLGIPGEWTWERYAELPSLGSALTLSLTGLVVLGVILLGARRIRRAGRLALTAWLTTLVLATFAWLWVVQEEVPNPLLRLSKAGWVLYYPGPSGYFTEAKRSSGNRANFLRNYTATLAKGDVLHQGTHPPGLIVAYWGLMDVSQGSAIAGVADGTQPESVASALDVIGELTARAPTPLVEADGRVLWLAMLLVQISVALCVVPLYALLGTRHDAETSWWAASLWAGVPAVAIFLPKSDALLAFTGLLGLLCWVYALRSSSVTGRILAAIATGLVFWLGLCISLATLPVGIAATVLTVWDVVSSPAGERGSRLRRVTVPVAVALSVLLGAIGLVALTTGMNLFEVWSWNFRNHAAFYAKFDRTWWKWLLVNPVELGVAAGLPLAILASLGLRLGPEVSSNPTPDAPPCPGSGLPFALVVTGLALWISGKNAGEAARLWIFLMPWLCLLAGNTLARAIARGERALPVLAVICQLACSAILTTHVSGFLSGIPAGSSGSAAPLHANR